VCSASYVTWQRETARVFCWSPAVPQPVDNSWPPGPQQQTPQRRAAVDWWHGQTDRGTLHGFIDPAPHRPTMRTVSITSYHNNACAQAGRIAAWCPLWVTLNILPARHVSVQRHCLVVTFTHCLSSSAIFRGSLGDSTSQTATRSVRPFLRGYGRYQQTQNTDHATLLRISVYIRIFFHKVGRRSSVIMFPSIYGNVQHCVCFNGTLNVGQRNQLRLFVWARTRRTGTI